MNILPEEKRLAEVSSNIWGTKFKIVGVSLNFLPQNLGQINYKASLLHLQPRQMTLEIIDLKEETNDPLGDDDGGEENDDVTSWLDEDQPSEDYDSESRPRQGRCNSRRSGPFMSDDEEDNDKGKQKKQSRSQNKYTSTF